MTRIPTVVLFGLSGLGLCISCTSNEPVMTPASGVAPRYTARETVATLVGDRCAYAQRCGAIGDGDDATYATFDECRQAFTADLSKRFGEECDNGVAYSDLQHCRDEVRNEDCGGVSGAIDSMDRYLACRPSELCLD